MQVSPNRTITLAGKDFALDGSFGTLRSVQESFDEDIVQVLIGVMDMRLDEVCKLIAIGSGKQAEEIGDAILDSVGVMTPEYALLKAELVAWLNVALAPKADREKKSAEMGQIIKGLSTSRGETTNA